MVTKINLIRHFKYYQNANMKHEEAKIKVSGAQLSGVWYLFLLFKLIHAVDCSAPNYLFFFLTGPCSHSSGTGSTHPAISLKLRVADIRLQKKACYCCHPTLDCSVKSPQHCVSFLKYSGSAGGCCLLFLFVCF